MNVDERNRRRQERAMADSRRDGEPLAELFADTRCHLCDRAGFVRKEPAMTAHQASVDYSCGSCHHAWKVFDQFYLIERRCAIVDRRRMPRGERRR